MSHPAPAAPGGHGAEEGKGREKPRGYVSVSRAVRSAFENGADAVDGVSRNLAKRLIAATAPKDSADKPGHKKEEAKAHPEKKGKAEGDEKDKPDTAKAKEGEPAKKEEAKTEEKKPEVTAEAHPAKPAETPATAPAAAAHSAPHGHEEKKGWSTGAKVGVGVLGTLAVAAAATTATAVYLGGKAIDAVGKIGEKAAEATGNAIASAPEWMKTIGSGITYPFRKTYGFFKGLFGRSAHAEPAHEEAHTEADHGEDHPATDAHAEEHKENHAAAAHHRRGFKKAA